MIGVPRLQRVMGSLGMDPSLLKSIFGDFGTLLSQRVMQRLMGFVSLYFMSRHLSQEAFGNYQFPPVALAAAGFFALTGLENAVMQAASRGGLAMFPRSNAYAFGCATLGSLSIAGFAIATRGSRPDAFVPLLIAAMSFPFYVGLAQWKSVLLGRQHIRKWSFIEVANSIVTNALLVGATFMGVTNIAVFTTCFVLPTCLINLTMTLRVLAQTRGEEATEDTRAESLSLMRYGIHTSLVGASNPVAEQIERMTLFMFVSPAVLAAYLAGDRISELIRSVVQDMTAILAPRFARTNVMSPRVQQGLRVAALISGVAVVIFAFTLASPLLLFVFGPAYAGSLPYAKALLCSVAIGNIGQFQFRFIRSQPDSHGFRQVTLATSASRIVCAIVLVWIWGVWGAIASVFIARGTLSLLSSYIIRKRYS